jgi:hypothetical protein
MAVSVAAAGAQDAGPAGPFGNAVSVGLSWSAPISFGSSDASLTSPSGAPFRLFSASTRVSGAPALDVRIDRRITRSIDAELALSYSWPALTTHLSGDAEEAAAVDASDPLRQFEIGGGALVHAPRWRIGRRAWPFVSAGGGYLRQLYRNRALVEDGGTVWFGGGFVVPLSSGEGERAGRLALRIDARMLGRPGSVLLDRRSHLTPAAGASLFARF